MGLFCKKCSSILRPKTKAGKKIMYCACGYEETPEGEMIICEELEEEAEYQTMDWSADMGSRFKPFSKIKEQFYKLSDEKW